MKKNSDLTEISPTGFFIKFVPPLMIGDVFHQLYLLADSVVVGRLLGVYAFAAIGAAAAVYLFLFDAVIGFSSGMGTRFAGLYGAKSYEQAKNAYAMSLLLSTVLGALVSVLCVLLVDPLLSVMNTPLDIIEDSAAYLRWLFVGLVPTFLYRTTSSVVLSTGDSKTPLYALILASVVNIALSIIFILGTPLGVAGVGMATVISHIIACGFLFARIDRGKGLSLSLSDFIVNFPEIKELTRISLPISARNTVSTVGEIVIQFVVNGYGVALIAGIAAAKKLYIVLFMVMNAMEPAIVTYVAQSFGARKLPRIKECMITARRIMLISSCAIMILMFFFGELLISLFLGTDTEAMKAAMTQLRVFLALLPAVYLLILYRSGLQGMGKTMPTLASGITEGLTRIIAILILPLFFGETGIFISLVIAWPITAAQLFFSYNSAYRKICE